MMAGRRERPTRPSSASKLNGRSPKGWPKRIMKTTWSLTMAIATAGRSGMLCGQRTSTIWRSCNAIAACVGK